jgi:hypothetical protein
MKPENPKSNTSWWGSTFAAAYNIVFWKNPTLHDVAYSGQAKELAALIFKYPAQINTLDALGYSPLHYAFKAKLLENALVLLLSNADPNVQANARLTKSSPIHTVMVDPDKSSLRLLLYFRANYNSLTDDTHKTAWQKADATTQQFITKTANEFAELQSLLATAKVEENKTRVNHADAYTHYTKSATILHSHARAETNAALGIFYRKEALWCYKAAADHAEFIIRDTSVRVSPEQKNEFANLYKTLVITSSGIEQDTIVGFYKNKANELEPQHNDPTLPTSIHPSQA